MLGIMIGTEWSKQMTQEAKLLEAIFFLVAFINILYFIFYILYFIFRQAG
jgi:hypothetical protein